MTEPIIGPEVHSQKLVSQAKARKFVSQNGRGYLALGVLGADGKPVDPEDLTLTVRRHPLDGGDPVVLVEAVWAEVAVPEMGLITRDAVGKFSYDIGPQHTAERGILTAEWTYEVGGAEFTFTDDMQILGQMPNYEALNESTKLLVEQASWFFADLFDSTTGGPWLNENFQTHFDYDRMAFLLRQATMKFNVTGWPVTQYGVGRDDKAIPANYTDLILWGTKLEAIRHLIASYTEQPDFRNMATTYTDRRDYSQRWREVWADEKPEYDKAVKMSKRALLSLGRGSLLVAGGIYGGGARGMYVPGLFAAMTRSMRFYPAAPSVSFGNQAFGLPR